MGCRGSGARLDGGRRRLDAGIRIGVRAGAIAIRAARHHRHRPLQGKINLLGVLSDVPNPIAVAAIDAIDTGYGHPNTPIGAVVGSDGGTFDHGYTDALVAKLPHSVNDSRDVPEAVALYQRVLKHAPNGASPSPRSPATRIWPAC